MKTIIKALFPFLIMAVNLSACSGKKDSITYVLIETQLGNIKIKLYNETPLHKENFIKLVKQGYYDNLLFHRVIKGFMIQGGDPSSKNAVDTVLLGSGDPGYTIPAEIMPQFFHKRGVLAAARELDADNPERRSSGSQFYIVQGHTFTDEELTLTEKRINQTNFQHLLNLAFSKERDSLQQYGIIAIYDSIMVHSSAQARTQLVPYKFSAEQRNIYKTLGGAPHLDGSFTIFGETIEGLDVLDKIAGLPTDANDRPIQDIKMKITLTR
jgi:peptidylprolyl isomerase